MPDKLEQVIMAHPSEKPQKFSTVTKVNVGHGGETQAPFQVRIEVRPDGTKVPVPKKNS